MKSEFNRFYTVKNSFIFGDMILKIVNKKNHINSRVTIYILWIIPIVTYIVED